MGLNAVKMHVLLLSLMMALIVRSNVTTAATGLSSDKEATEPPDNQQSSGSGDTMHCTIESRSCKNKWVKCTKLEVACVLARRNRREKRKCPDVHFNKFRHAKSAYLCGECYFAEYENGSTEAHHTRMCSLPRQCRMRKKQCLPQYSSTMKRYRIKDQQSCNETWVNCTHLNTVCNMSSPLKRKCSTWCANHLQHTQSIYKCNKCCFAEFGNGTTEAVHKEMCSIPKQCLNPPKATGHGTQAPTRNSNQLCTPEDKGTMCTQWLWNHRTQGFYVDQGRSCLALNRTYLTTKEIEHNCSTFVKEPNPCRRPKSIRDCMESKLSSEGCTNNLPMRMMSKLLGCKCQQRKRPTIKCDGNCKVFLNGSLCRLHPVEDLYDVSMQTTTVSEAANMLEGVQNMSKQEQCGMMAGFQMSVKQTFMNSCNWRKRLFKKKSRQGQNTQVLVDSYADMVSAMLSSARDRRKKRREARQARRQTENSSSQNSNLISVMLDSTEEMLESVPSYNNTALVVATPQLAMAVVCPSSANTTVSVHVLVPTADRSNLSLTVNSKQDMASTDNSSLLSIHLHAFPADDEDEADEDEDDAESSPCTALPLQFFVFRHPDFFEEHFDSGKYDIATPVVSAAVATMESANLTDKPIKIMFNYKSSNGGNVECGYWNVTDNEWKTNGCRLAHRNKTHVGCECTHLTSFALLVVPAGPDTVTGQCKADAITSYTLRSLSGICLLVTIGNILLFRELRKRQFQRIILLICFTMAVATIIVLAALERTSNASLCKATAIILHFSLLSLFGMVVVACAHLYAKIVSVFETKRRVHWSWIVAGVGPAVTVAIAAAVTKGDAYGGTTMCWFDKSQSLRYNVMLYGTFISPMGLMLAYTLTAYCHIVVRMVWRQQREKRSTKFQQYRRLFSSLVGLASVVGLSWILILILAIADHCALRIVANVVQSAQGIAIFAFYTLGSHQVRKTWSSWGRRTSADFSRLGKSTSALRLMSISSVNKVKWYVQQSPTVEEASMSAANAHHI